MCLQVVHVMYHAPSRAQKTNLHVAVLVNIPRTFKSVYERLRTKRWENLCINALLNFGIENKCIAKFWYRDRHNRHFSHENFLESKQQEQ